MLARAFASAAGRYLLYAAAFVAIAAFAPLAVAAAFVRHTPAAVASATAALHADGRLTIVALALIAAVAAIMFALLIGDLGVLLRIKARARIARRSERQARCAIVACSADVQTPTAIGYFHPRIVVPLDLAGRITDDEWNAIVAHENAHLLRYDDWAKAVQSALVRLLWFSPALWWLGARLDLERELASDERATVARDPRAYAACLVRLAADVRPSAAPAAWTARSQVAIRVERLVRPQARRPLAAAGAAAVFAVAIAAAFGVAITLEPPVSAPSAILQPPAIVAEVRAPAPLELAPSEPPVIGAATAHRRPPAAVVVAVAQNRPLSRSAAPAPAGDRTPPVRVAAIPAIELPAAPCRSCVLLRRPVEDQPSRHRRPAGSIPAASTAPAVPAQAFVSAPVPRPATFLPAVEPEEPGASAPTGPFVFLPSSR